MLLVLALAGGQPAYLAFGAGLIVAVVAMVAFGLGRSFWAGAEVREASAGPASVKLADAAEDPIRTLNERVDAQVSELEERIYALEQESEKRDGNGDDDTSLVEE